MNENQKEEIEMDSSQHPEKDESRKTDAMLRRMGMSLSVLGSIVFAVGLVAYRQGSGGAPNARSVLILTSSLTMLAAGLYIWRSAKISD